MKKVLLIALCLVASSAAAQKATVKSLMTHELAGGKEGEMVLVEYAPGGWDPEHRHDANTFVYVLEGSVVMQVKGGKEVTLGPGDTFHEAPGDVHTVSKNASTTEPAKFLVVFVKEKGAPNTVPTK